MRRCPFKGCEKTVGDIYFGCGEHWSQLTAEEKRQIQAAYDEYKADSIGLEQLRERQARVLEAWEGRPRESTGRKVVKCRTCSQPMFWATSESSGKTIPMDADPSAQGNMFERNGEFAAVSLTNQPPDGAVLYKSHFATCAQARVHRRPRR